MNYSEQQKMLIEGVAERLRSGDSIGSTVVEMRSDYENDPEMCLTSVIFLPRVLQLQILKTFIEPLRKIQPNHYYIPPKSLHLTIKNVRTIHNPPLFNLDDKMKVDKCFREIIPKQKSFTFDLKGLIRFPTSVSLVGYSNELLYSLVHALENGLNDIGVPDNKKYVSNSVFFGHVSLCRFSEQPSEAFLNKVIELQNIEIGSLFAKEISLISCNSVCSANSKEIIGTYLLSD